MCVLEGSGRMGEHKEKEDGCQQSLQVYREWKIERVDESSAWFLGHD